MCPLDRLVCFWMLDNMSESGQVVGVVSASRGGVTWRVRVGGVEGLLEDVCAGVGGLLLSEEVGWSGGLFGCADDGMGVDRPRRRGHAAAHGGL